jgi:hypothetical protein
VTPSGSEEPRPEILENSPRWWAKLFRPEFLAVPTLPLLNRIPRWLFALVAAVLLAGGGTVLLTSHTKHPAPNATPAAHTVYLVPSACAGFISTTVPHVAPGYRVTLRDAAMPPAYFAPQPPATWTGHGLWHYGWKTGFSFLGQGLPVTISVPAAWHGRLALFAPPGGPSSFTTQLHVPSCPPPGAWNTFVTAFYLHTPSACVPLDVQVGRRSATVWFGLGQHCPANQV